MLVRGAALVAASAFLLLACHVRGDMTEVLSHLESAGRADLASLLSTLTITRPGKTGAALNKDELFVVNEVLKQLNDTTLGALADSASAAKREADDACSDTDPCEEAYESVEQDVKLTGEDVDEKRKAHTACREAIAAAQDGNASAWQKLVDHVHGLATGPPGAGGEGACEIPAPKVPSDAVIDYLDKTQEWADAASNKYKELLDAWKVLQDDMNSKGPECSSLQKAFEDVYCTYNRAQSENNVDKHSCQVARNNACTGAVADGQKAINDLGFQYGAASKAICYLRALATNDLPDLQRKIDVCKSTDFSKGFPVHPSSLIARQLVSALQQPEALTPEAFAAKEYSSLPKNAPADPVTGIDESCSGPGHREV